MAIQFDESDDCYTIVDAAELTLQDGDWCIGVWLYVSDNAGAHYQYVISNNSTTVNNSCNVYLEEDDLGVLGPTWIAKLVDGDGTTVYLEDPNDPGADSVWRLTIIQRSTADNEIQLWRSYTGGTATKLDGEADTGFAAINGGDWSIGRRADGNADRFYGGVCADLFKMDHTLTQAQIEALAGGLPIKTLAKQAGLTLDIYLPMWRADATLLDYSGNGNVATRVGVPVTAAHPPICTPVKRRRM